MQVISRKASFGGLFFDLFQYPFPKELLSKLNPMGFKGAGEGGIVAVAGAVGNAVAHALSKYDIKITDLPLTPMRIHELLKEKGA